MGGDGDWSADLEILARGYDGDEGEQLRAHVDRAGAQAKAGNLALAADSLESARRAMVGRNHFRRYDNDIWVFTDIIRCIRRQSSEQVVPEAYQRFFDAVPGARIGEPMTRAQKAFWYGAPDAEVGGEIRLVPSAAGSGGSEPKKACFIATAACGSPASWEVEALRTFRDRTLLGTWGGCVMIEAYYKISPPLARMIGSRPGLRGLVRRLLIAPLARALGGRAAGPAR